MSSAKRKRDEVDDALPKASKRQAIEEGEIVVQITCGSYERVLHGFTAAIPKSRLVGSTPDDTETEAPVTFSDSFLFNAHASAIRCLALSPSSDATPQQRSRRILATGSTDERINVYQLSTAAPSPAARTKQTSVLPMPSLHAPRNKEIGTLMHHSSAVTALHFSSRGKLLSASMDNTIAIARTRDWTVLSTIKAPIPKSLGRPSGDTFAPGEVPAGINAVAVHPSAKLMLSVGQGERCMRLWNLITGKKAGVLTFEKKLLQEIGEARYRGGEAREVFWAPDGEEFAVAFERGLLVYGLDCQVRGLVGVGLRTRICKIQYLPDTMELGASNDTAAEKTTSESILAVSTEDGRILLYNTTQEPSEGKTPRIEPVAQIGQQQPGHRIKDFSVLELATGLLFVVASSSGRVSLWSIDYANVSLLLEKSAISQQGKPKQIGAMLGSYETARRITCLAAFQMDSPVEAAAAAAGIVQATNPTTNGVHKGAAQNGNDVDAEGIFEAEDGFEGFED